MLARPRGSSELVDVARRARPRPAPPNAALALLARPLGVELVGDVGEHDPLGAGAPGVLAGLAGGQVAADPGALGPRQGRLDEQQVGLARGLDQLLAGPAVGAEGEPAGGSSRRLTAWVRM